MTVHQVLDSSLHGFQTGPTRKKPKKDFLKKEKNPEQGVPQAVLFIKCL